jgi:predicted dehydrogenase
MPINDPLGCAIIGSGMIARYHAAAIAATPGARLVAMAASSPARASAAAAAFGVPCHHSLAGLLADPAIDIVTICTPSGMHAAQAIAAARTGKHVLVEKPLALSLADADAMIAACDAAGVRLAVALQRRTDPVFIQVWQAIASGALGQPILATVAIPYIRDAAYYASAAWRGSWALDGGGALMNQGIHLIDLLLWFFGDAVEVQAQAATLAHAIDVEDCLSATVRFASGAQGTIAATTAAAPGFPHRIELYGTRGGIQIEGESIARWEVPGIEPHGVHSGPADAGAGARPGGIQQAGHTRIIADLVAACREGRAPLVDGREARRALAFVLAAYESARHRRAVCPA